MAKGELLDRYHKIRRYLESFIPSKKKRFPGRRGLKRMRKLLSLLGDPHLKYPTVHVAGTSGKGSTATILAWILSKAGYKTGLTVSPHLQLINERMQVDGCLATVAELEQLLREIKQIELIEQIEQLGMGPPSYFELLLAMAFRHFAKKKVDIAVVEAGLGGRYDGTNVIKPVLGIITNVGLDHTEVLGQTVEAIAKDKAGIIKPEMMIVSGVEQPNVRRIIKAKSEKLHGKTFFLGEDFGYRIEKLTSDKSFFHFEGFEGVSFNKETGLFFSTRGGGGFSLTLQKKSSKPSSVGLAKSGFCLPGIELSLVGKHQVENAALALAAAFCLKESGFFIKKTAIRRALKQLKIPGRLEIMQQNPLVVLDGAHNPDKMTALVEALPLFGKGEWIVVFAAKKDKPVADMLNSLLLSDLLRAKLLIITQFMATTDVGKNMAMPVENILAMATKFRRFMAKENIEIKTIPEAAQAVKAAMAAAGRGGRVLVTGSLYLVGQVRDLWQPKAKLLTL